MYYNTNAIDWHVRGDRSNGDHLPPLRRNLGIILAFGFGASAGSASPDCSGSDLDSAGDLASSEEGAGGGAPGGSGGCGLAAATGFFVFGIRAGFGDSLRLGGAPGGKGGCEDAPARSDASSSLMLIGDFLVPPAFSFFPGRTCCAPFGAAGDPII